MATLQVSLLNQIIQNFLQNAIKVYTIKMEVLLLKVHKMILDLLIEVIDEGCGIDESVDLICTI